MEIAASRLHRATIPMTPSRGTAAEETLESTNSEEAGVLRHFMLRASDANKDPVAARAGGERGEPKLMVAAKLHAAATAAVVAFGTLLLSFRGD